MNQKLNTHDAVADDATEPDLAKSNQYHVAKVGRFHDAIGKALQLTMKYGIDLNDAAWWTAIVAPRLLELDRAMKEELDVKDLLIADAKDSARKLNTELGAARNALAQLRAQRDRERERLPAAAREDFAQSILSAADAIDAAGRSLEGADERVLQGFEFISKMMKDSLKSQGFSKIDEVGVPFDHNLHESVGEVESDERPAGSVIEVFLNGYVNDANGVLLRPAKVVVAKARSSETDDDVTT